MRNVTKNHTSLEGCRAAKGKGWTKRVGAHKQIWVFVEQQRGQAHPVSQEVMGAGRKLADKLQVDLAAVVIGPEGDVTSNTALDSCSYGADLAYLVAHNVLAGYYNEFYARALTDLISVYKPGILLFGATRLGRKIGGSLAATLSMVITADCTDLDVDVDGSLATICPSPAGSPLLCTIYNAKSRPQMATVRPGVIAMPERVERGGARIVIHPLDLVDDHNVAGMLSSIRGPHLRKSDLLYRCLGWDLDRKGDLISYVRKPAVPSAEYRCSRFLISKAWTAR
ncbi:electron transfer flavoprotein subunit alpha [Bradyrhizobium brasilense]|uniref:electron transfer flavoprotein subunit alpha/FixB family protein n=1 Tax=Bradyrhizobium brasilense TaxID=1419277 RepID=UPI0024B13759|nr:electron transfer flavoprotein subunit alpha [Bradyrhizobium australafricanum]WFU31338.1 electron transfer flavoprotein subunit alpha [Bradyrhizobium australafricanum]